MMKPAVLSRGVRVIEEALGHLAAGQQELGEVHAELRSVEMSLLESNGVRGYRPEHFRLEELVPPELFNALGESCWWFLDDRMVWTLDAIRERFKASVIVNTWYWGGKNRYRGLRPFDCAEGAPMSQHKFGRAFDLTVKGVSAEELYQEVLTHQEDPTFRHIRAIKRYSWGVHIDGRNSGQALMMEL